MYFTYLYKLNKSPVKEREGGGQIYGGSDWEREVRRRRQRKQGRRRERSAVYVDYVEEGGRENDPNCDFVFTSYPTLTRTMPLQSFSVTLTTDTATL